MGNEKVVYHKPTVTFKMQVEGYDIWVVPDCTVTLDDFEIMCSGPPEKRAAEPIKVTGYNRRSR